jgi:hypothetical protein
VSETMAAQVEANWLLSIVEDEYEIRKGSLMAALSYKLA